MTAAIEKHLRDASRLAGDPDYSEPDETLWGEACAIVAKRAIKSSAWQIIDGNWKVGDAVGAVALDPSLANVDALRQAVMEAAAEWVDDKRNGDVFTEYARLLRTMGDE